MDWKECPMAAMKKGYKALIEEANAEIKAVSPAEAAELARRGDALLVDIRDVRELQREGRIPGALHAPRGMLEFWVDPESPYHKDVFASGRTFVFFCAGGLRSALATKTVQDMGLAPVMHIEGGFGAWRQAGLPVEMPEPKR
jgi:rhodanese-related sulfurtransferase